MVATLLILLVSWVRWILPTLILSVCSVSLIVVVPLMIRLSASGFCGLLLVWLLFIIIRTGLVTWVLSMACLCLRFVIGTLVVVLVLVCLTMLFVLLLILALCLSLLLMIVLVVMLVVLVLDFLAVWLGHYCSVTESVWCLTLYRYYGYIGLCYERG